MTERPADHTPAASGPARRPRLRLPFDDRREDAGTWAYDHRMGLCITLIAYLVLMIVFVSSKIVVGRRAPSQGMYIDLQTLAELEKERDRLQEEVQRKQQEEQLDWKSIRNAASNENALNEALKDDRGTNASELNDAAAEAADRMRANREAYEQGLAEEAAIRQRSGTEEGSEHQDRKVRGGRRRGGGDCGRPFGQGGQRPRRLWRRRLHARGSARCGLRFDVQHRSVGPYPTARHDYLYIHPAIKTESNDFRIHQ